MDAQPIKGIVSGSSTSEFARGHPPGEGCEMGSQEFCEIEEYEE